MTSEALNPSWQIGDPDIQIGNASLQFGYKDVSPTSRGRHVTRTDRTPGPRARRVPTVFQVPRR